MDDEIGKSKSGNEQESENQAHTNRLTDKSLADKASFAGVAEGINIPMCSGPTLSPLPFIRLTRACLN
mgnify:CR=1 FL=1